MSEEKRLYPKVLRDTAVLSVVVVVFIVVLYYGARRIDPAAAVDGLGNFYAAAQVLIIAFACASLTSTIHWLMFGMLGRRERREPGIYKLAVLQSCSWLVVFYLLLSRAVGQ